MSLAVVVVGPPARTLDEIADSIRSHWTATEEDRFAIGRDLVDARKLLPGDTEFGQWLDHQAFPFSRQWAHTLRLAAQHEPEVRLALSTQVDSGQRPNLKRAVRTVVPPTPRPPKEGAQSIAARTTVTEARASIRSVQLSLAQLGPHDVVPAARPVIRAFALGLIEWARQWSETDASGVE